MKRAPWLVLVLTLLAGSGAAAQTAATGETGKIPITAESEKARELYLEGRHLAETLHLTEAYAKYGETVAAEPDFALAHYGRATSSPTAATFFESLERSVALAGGVSEAERHMILGLQAGATSKPDEQLAHYTALVQAYPEDERAHTLLAAYYNGNQDYEAAVEHYSRAIEINPEFTPAYNVLGYAYRFLARYDEAERTFQKYIELLPNEPNPYDSYAELLMKVGRFEESIENYRKALAIDPAFTFSYVGIGHNQMLMGRGAEARATFEELYEKAPNDGLRRTALFWTAASYVHEGKRDEALEAVRRMSSIAEKAGDKVAVSGDLVLMGDIILETGGSPDEALPKYRESVKVMEAADAPAEVKEATRRNQLYYEALVALAKGDLAGAKSHTEAYGKEVETARVPFEIWQLHELTGRIALVEGDVTSGLADLQKSNQQDPRILWEISRAYERAGDHEQAQAWAKKAAEFNQQSFPYAYVRSQAREAART